MGHFSSPAERLRDSDEGMTLTELLVYIILLGVVMAIVVSIVMSSSKAQSQAQDSSMSSTTANLVSQSISGGIRNASAFKVTTVGTGGDMLVRARSSVVTLVSGAPHTTWYCLGWYYRASDGGMLAYRASTGPISATPTLTSGWTLIGTGAQRVGSDAIFTLATTGGSISALTVHFKVGEQASTPPLEVQSTYSLRPQTDTTTGPTTCF